uniref:Putative tick ixodegrin n=1 Tax=Rhipicephalus microplus TaxID=6941 RepID=A0A6G5A560_RHIMP
MRQWWKKNEIPPMKGNDGDSCDGNDECGLGLCCFRPNVDAGTVCGPLGGESKSCSNVTLKEYSTPENTNEISCRQDEEAAETTEDEYKPPYDGACPCKYGFFCKLPEATEGSENPDSVPLGTCEAVQTLEGNEI